MIVTILGNGGAINNGLPYNAFMINRNFLCETPPDIMRSLFEHGFQPHDIDAIFISHFHGDHIFGVPFLLLNSFIGRSKPLRFIGPESIREKVFEITGLAFGGGHPCLKWLESNGVFTEISDGSEVMFPLSGRITFFSLNHFTDTYGFEYSHQDVSPFVYIADTLWCENIRKVLKRKPNHVLLDLNGEPDDPVQVHLSEKDLIEKCLPVTGNSTVYYGTHLKKPKQSKIKRLIYTTPGMMITI